MLVGGNCVFIHRSRRWVIQYAWISCLVPLQIVWCLFSEILVAKDGFTHKGWLLDETMSKWEELWLHPDRTREWANHWACVRVFSWSSFLWSFTPWVYLENKVSSPLLSLELSQPPSCSVFVYLTKQMFSFAWAWGLYFLPSRLISMATKKRETYSRGKKYLWKGELNQGVSKNLEMANLRAVFEF